MPECKHTEAVFKKLKAGIVGLCPTCEARTAAKDSQASAKRSLKRMRRMALEEEHDTPGRPPMFPQKLEGKLFRVCKYHLKLLDAYTKQHKGLKTRSDAIRHLIENAG